MKQKTLSEQIHKLPEEVDDIIRVEDVKQFIKEILEEIDNFKDECRVFGVDDEDDKYNEDYNLNCRGVLEGLEDIKQTIKQKAGFEDLKWNGKFI